MTTLLAAASSTGKFVKDCNQNLRLFLPHLLPTLAGRCHQVCAGRLRKSTVLITSAYSTRVHRGNWCLRGFLERLAGTHTACSHRGTSLWSTGAYMQVLCPLDLALFLGLDRCHSLCCVCSHFFLKKIEATIPNLKTKNN